MEALAQIKAAIDICRETPDFYRSPNINPHDYFRIDQKITSIIQTIESQYNAKDPYLAVIYAATNYKEDREFRKRLSLAYNNKCSPQLVADSQKELVSIESAVKRKK